MKRAKRTKRTNKNYLAVLVFALVLVFFVTAGTIAWLTRKSSISNTFTIGTFNSPTTDPTDSSITIDIDGNLYEPSWNKNVIHKLVPSASFPKDPYVGIGAGSEDAVVYVKVDNNFSNKVYFTINNGWTAVSGQTTAGSAADTYTSGIFKYTAGLQGNASSDSWTTTPLFSSIVTADNATVADFTPVQQGADTEIVVTSFLHQAKDASNNDILSATIEAAAIQALNN